MRVAKTGAAQRIRFELDRTLRHQQHDCFAEHPCQHDRFANFYQHATVHRIIDMPAATAGRRG